MPGDLHRDRVGVPLPRSRVPGDVGGVQRLNDLAVVDKEVRTHSVRTSGGVARLVVRGCGVGGAVDRDRVLGRRAIPVFPLNKGKDRKSTRLNSSHVKISYAVFCLKKK